MANNFNTLAKEPTEKFQKLIHNVARKESNYGQTSNQTHDTNEGRTTKI